jgi:predicted NAD/FAD-binding protein
MRIAIIGTGIAGMVAAYLLSDEHELVVYEAEDYVGGHTNTLDVSLNGTSYAVEFCQADETPGGCLATV